MGNAGLEEGQAGIKITGRNINNLRYADDTTLMAESEEELKNLLSQASLSITSSRTLLKFMSIELVMQSNISSSVIPFSFCHQSFPTSGSFPMSQFFTSGGQSIGVSALASFLPKKSQG